jgi:hypothetical protein
VIGSLSVYESAAVCSFCTGEVGYERPPGGRKLFPEVEWKSQCSDCSCLRTEVGRQAIFFDSFNPMQIKVPHFGEWPVCSMEHTKCGSKGEMEQARGLESCQTHVSRKSSKPALPRLTIWSALLCRTWRDRRPPTTTRCTCPSTFSQDVSTPQCPHCCAISRIVD